MHEIDDDEDEDDEFDEPPPRPRRVVGKLELVCILCLIVFAASAVLTLVVSTFAYWSVGSSSILVNALKVLFTGGGSVTTLPVMWRFAVVGPATVAAFSFPVAVVSGVVYFVKFRKKPLPPES